MRFRRVKTCCGRLLSAVGVVSLSLLLVSCGAKKDKSGPRHKTYPVQGQVFINGEPATGVRVKLHPEIPHKQLSQSRAGIVSYGSVDADGVFKISTYVKFDGAPAGNYKISLVWPASSTTNSGFVDTNEEPADQFYGTYADADTNAANDPEHFAFDIVEGTSKLLTLPPIDLQVEGSEDTE